MIVAGQNQQPAEHRVRLARARMRARAHAADIGRHVNHVVRTRRQCAERRFGGSHEGGCIDRPGRTDDDIAAAVVALHVLRQVVARQPPAVDRFV